MSGPAQTVYVVDDEASVRDALVALMESAGLAAACYPSAEGFLEAVRPDARGCLLLDVRMPGMGGVALQRRLNEAGYTLPVVVVSGHGDVPLAVEMMRQGAADFVEKPFDGRALLERVRELLAADAAAAEDGREVQAIRDGLARLTPREREVFEAVVDGKPSKTIAAELGISPRTVDVHRNNVMEKLGVRNAAGLVRQGMRVRRQTRGED